MQHSLSVEQGFVGSGVRKKKGEKKNEREEEKKRENENVGK